MSCTKAQTILIVEDDKEAASNMRYFLEPHFRSVYTANNVDEAMELYTKKRPSMLLSDIEIANKNGLDMIKEIRKSDSKILIFVITGHQKEEYMLNAVPLRLDGYFLKPITSSRLISVLKESCSRLLNEYLISSRPRLVYSFDKKLVITENGSVSLTNSEIELLELLVQNQNRVVPYSLIEERVYEGKEMSKNALRTLVKKLKQKIPSIPLQSRFGVGYILRERERGGGVKDAK